MLNRVALIGPVSLTGPNGVSLRRASQQRRIALLALVASSPGETISRDRLLGFLWPDRDEATARHLLADSIYVLAPRPTHILHRVDVPYFANRDMALKSAPEFRKVEQQLLDLLYRS